MILVSAFLRGEELCHSFSFFVDFWTGAKGMDGRKELNDRQESKGIATALDDSFGKVLRRRTT